MGVKCKGKGDCLCFKQVLFQILSDMDKMIRNEASRTTHVSGFGDKVRKARLRRLEFVENRK